MHLRGPIGFSRDTHVNERSAETTEAIRLISSIHTATMTDIATNTGTRPPYVTSIIVVGA